MYQYIIVSEQNKTDFLNKVLTYLKGDFYKKDSPNNHFWHNFKIISDAFKLCDAMVVLNKESELLAFMNWSIIDIRIEIDIAVVDEKYRKQGILKKMIQELIQKKTNMLVLTGQILPQAQPVFSRLGWQEVKLNSNGALCKPTDNKKYYKTLTPVLTSVEELPSGKVIALFSKEDRPESYEYIDYYKVKENLDKYTVKYFQISLDDDSNLITPIITPFHDEGYVGVYYNRNLIIDGKARHIFSNDLCQHGLFIMKKCEPLKPELFKAVGFFNKQKNKKRKRSAGFFNTKTEKIEDELLEEKEVKKSKILTKKG